MINTKVEIIVFNLNYDLKLNKLQTSFHSEILVSVFPNPSFIWFGEEVTQGVTVIAINHNCFSVLYAFNATCFYSYCNLFHLIYKKPTSG